MTNEVERRVRTLAQSQLRLASRPTALSSR